MMVVDLTLCTDGAKVEIRQAAMGGNPPAGVDIRCSFNLADEISRSLGLQPYVANFVNILVDMKRVDLIKEIAAEFELIANRLSETEVATVASMVELEPQHLAEIAKRVQKLIGAKNVKLKTMIDKSLLTGITIRYGNSDSKLIDLSVKKQLEEIDAQLHLGDIQLVG
ncbi:ATP synthase delta chain, chloroplastic-like [Salvia splendens]|nr:ATP synthase delta chain, chloroplastic-like [Salvia splendens]